ncbi:MAG: adenosine deaminase [Alphaproteobacteria bacterium]|nr:adenosine deaminase [Alphaproteobacteria bacterium]MCB9693726.1 adenosine deaminase [Alphaproteobacteria bacterium]
MRSTESLRDFCQGLPKAELHLHIEGTFEPELLFAIAARNGVPLRFPTVEALREAYAFTDLQSFLDIYYEGAGVLLHEADFFDLTWAYLLRAAADGVRHVEIFFDPQTHTDRGVPFATVLDGIERALKRGEDELGVSYGIILCFLRHLPEDAALATFEEARPHLHRLVGVGLDSSEVGFPPSGFQRVFALAREAGLHVVAHAGEEGPPAYVYEALDLLRVERVDHGVRSIEDPALVRRLVEGRIPLTVCPLSNTALKVFGHLRDHTLAGLHEAGVVVTLNSDDPAYFGGYIAQNFLETAVALGLDRATLATFARNSFEAAFLPEARKRELMAEVDAFVAG